MGIPGSANPMLFGGAGAYQINQSLRFNSADSAYLNRTPASAGNRKTWTWSGWVKRGDLGTNQVLLAAPITAGVTEEFLYFTSANQFEHRDGGFGTYVLSTSVFRDSSAWYHIVYAYDSAQATQSDRGKLYVNGTLQTLTTAVISSNRDSAINNNVAHGIGRVATIATNYFNGYLAEVNFIDGSALTPSSFGETDTITGAWIPKKYSGSYGTNGFYLKFDPSATNGIGHDHSGNGNNFTATGFSTSGTGTDVMSDTPTNNYATWNPLDNFYSSHTLSEGNLRATTPVGANYAPVKSTFGMSTGKWYWECVDSSGTSSSAAQFGIVQTVNANDYLAAQALSVAYSGINGQVARNTSLVTTAATFNQGDVIAFAFDADALTLAIYKNNTLQTTVTGITAGVWFAAGSDNTSIGGGYKLDANFGQRAFAYTPPTGYKALNTANLPEPTIKKPSTYFEATAYSGTTGSQAITGLGFSPDFVWIKRRNSTNSHVLQDAVRGAGKTLFSNATNAESGNSGDLITSFDSAGFTVNDTYLGGSGGGGTNASGGTYVAWCWDANGAGSSNTAGTITSTVSANATAGFSIVTYTGNGTAGATVGHGLGVAPKMIIVKQRNGTFTWRVYHGSLANTQVLYLSATDAATTETTAWNSTTPTSTTFTLGTSSGTNANTNTYVAYCFSEVAGYSKFGSYTGNGSTDGPFVFCGFRPRWIMIKVTNVATTSWMIRDTARNPYNIATGYLFPNSSSAEFTNLDFDIYSNGFKPRHTNNVENSSGSNYIFAAFAELPAKYSNAR